MQSMRLAKAALIVAGCIGFQPAAALADATAWSTNAASCVPVSETGLTITAGAVTAGAGTTVTLYCGITRAALTGGFDSIEITYKGGIGIVVGNAGAADAAGGAEERTGAIIPIGSSLTSEFIEMSKATGNETVKCGIQAKNSSTVTTERNLCENSVVDFNTNLYYLRIVLRSGIVAGQQRTVFGSSLISTR
ncbi:hypothetical protein [Bradyrhizobium sp.]|uniref:hypothetical protein n=1 Tax=Bradyrhizobium sp. TaxID=376 RepID=UPI0025B96797|nr:hypothetical protein [Bradyrhizobium sp.]